MLGIHSDKMGFTDKDGRFRYILVKAGDLIPERLDSVEKNQAEKRPRSFADVIARYYGTGKPYLEPSKPRLTDWYVLVKSEYEEPEVNEYGEVAP